MRSGLIVPVPVPVPVPGAGPGPGRGRGRGRGRAEGGAEGGADTVDPMGGLVVERLLAAGESQSACRLATYYNAIQPVTQRFDGFLLIVYAGGGTRVEAAGPGPALESIPEELRSVLNILPFGSHRLRPDLATPALVLNSETEVLWYLPVRQPDTGTHRLWEVAGTAHLDGGFGEGMEAEWQRDFGEVVSMPLIEAVAGPPNTLSYGPAANAALRHLWSWMKDGVPPPEQARVELAAGSAPGSQPELLRDELGNAIGGIRLPDFAVPTATHVGASVGPVPDLAGQARLLLRKAPCPLSRPCGVRPALRPRRRRGSGQGVPARGGCTAIAGTGGSRSSAVTAISRPLPHLRASPDPSSPDPRSPNCQPQPPPQPLTPRAPLARSGPRP